MYSSFYIFMFKEIKKYGLIDKIMIIIMANLKNDVKFGSEVNVKMYMYMYVYMCF